MFTSDMCVFVCVSVRSQLVNQSSLGLSANSYIPVKAINYKVVRYVPGKDSTDMILENLKKIWAWPRSHDYQNFWSLHVYSSRTLTATGF